MQLSSTTRRAMRLYSRRVHSKSEIRPYVSWRQTSPLHARYGPFRESPRRRGNSLRPDRNTDPCSRKDRRALADRADTEHRYFQAGRLDVLTYAMATLMSNEIGRASCRERV